MTHPRYLPDVLAAAREAEANAKDVAAIEVAVHRHANTTIIEHSSTGTTESTLLTHPESVVTIDDLRANALAWCGMMRRTVPDGAVIHRPGAYPDPLWEAVRARLAANALTPDVAARELRLLRAAHGHRYPQYAGLDYEPCGLGRIARDLDHPRKNYRVADRGEVVLIDPFDPDRTNPGYVTVWGLSSACSTSVDVHDVDVILREEG